ncbi:unnamed protein product [Closterium sp. NIES-64]|nr:unnamed protein product [Closterium sp. NIES-64]CAI5992270.1 unnamed protein product [Closterium sp. NIES-65]
MASSAVGSVVVSSSFTHDAARRQPTAIVRDSSPQASAKRTARHRNADIAFRQFPHFARPANTQTRRVNGFRLSAYAEAASESGRPAGGSAGQASGTRGSAGRGDSTSGEFVDTRIHWSSPDEGWVGGNSSGFSSEEEFEARSSDAGLRTAMSRDMQLLIMSNSNNHYTVLGVSPLADTDDVKAAYRRLSKRFHPDTTRLPLALAEQQFVRLNQAYEVLSSSEDRRLYDWKLAQEASDARGGRFVWPYEVDRTQRGMGSRDPPSPVGRRGPGEDENDVPLSDGSIMALAFDAFAVLIAVACICYAAFFKGN